MYKKKCMYLVGVIILLISLIGIENTIGSNDTHGSQKFALNNDNDLIKNSFPKNLGVIQRDYKADGTIIERKMGVDRVQTDTPGVGSGTHPLGVPQMRFSPIDELAFVCSGLSTNFIDLNTVDINLIENGIESPTYETMLDTSCSYSEGGGQAMDAASGDVDGDSQDELVIIDEFGRVRIYKYDLNARKFNPQPYNLIIKDPDGYCYYSISLNQFNADPGLEIAIAFGRTTRIQIWDPVNSTGGYYLPGEQSSTSGKPGGIAEFPDADVCIIDIETGDFNGDGYVEIITLSYTGNLKAFQYKSLSITEIADVQLSNGLDQGYPITFPQVLATGDFNGDNLLDVAVMECGEDGWRDWHCEYYYVVKVFWIGFEFGGTDFVTLDEEDVSTYGIWYPSIGAGDVDGDGLYETVVVGKHEKPSGTDSWEVLVFEDLVNKAKGPKTHFVGEAQCPWAAKSISFSDVDFDGADEICFSSIERYGNCVTEKYLLGELAGRNTSIVKIDPETNPWSALVLSPSDLPIGYPIPGDYDGDGVVLEYTGQHYPRITPQMPIFVLAAPPNYFDLNGEGTGTAVSTSESTGEEASDQFSVMAGIRVSFGVEFKLFGMGAKIKSSLEANYQFTQTKTTTNVETIGIRYSSGYKDNQVVYDAVDYESYIYKVIKHPYSNMTGANMSIDIPIGVSIYSTTVSLYNSGNSTNTIGSETYTHTVGKPGTYPSRVDVDALTGVVKILEPTEVPQGSSIACGTSLTYTRETAESVEKEHSIQLIWTVGVELGGLGLDRSVGYGHAWANKVTYGQSMAYEGTVACIEDENDWLENKYSWGLFVQNIDPENGFSYQLVHYYTEGDFDRGSDLDKIISDVTEFVEDNTVIVIVGGSVLLVMVVIIIKKLR
jgi:hypothetical protein